LETPKVKQQIESEKTPSAMQSNSAMGGILETSYKKILEVKDLITNVLMGDGC
jgi:hypothetical protein